MWRNYTNSEFLCDFGLKNTNFDLHARFPAIPNSPTPKSHKHSEIRDISDTVQGLGLVLVRNDQPFDLPYPYGEYRRSGVYGGHGYMAKMGCLGHNFRAMYLLLIVPIPKHLSSLLVIRSHELPNLKIWAETVLIRPRTTYFSGGYFARGVKSTRENGQSYKQP